MITIEQSELNKRAMKTIIDRFKKIDPTWSSCGDWDIYGMYSFLNGPKAYTIHEAIPDVQKEIDLIKTFVESGSESLV